MICLGGRWIWYANCEPGHSTYICSYRSQINPFLKPVQRTEEMNATLWLTPAFILQIGYMVPSDPKLRQLSYWPAASGEARDGTWACSPAENSYPSLSHSLMHPCAAGGTNCCGHPTAPIITRFNSFFSAEHAVLIMAYEAWPICGDGTDMEIVLTSTGAAKIQYLVFSKSSQTYCSARQATKWHKKISL